MHHWFCLIPLTRLEIRKLKNVEWKKQKIPNSRSNNNFDQIIAVVTYDFSVNVVDGLNVLGLVVFSVALGIIISRLGETGKPLYAFFFGLAEAMMKLVILVIW